MRMLWQHACVMASCICIAQPALMAEQGSAGPDSLVIRVQGNCPGALRVVWEGATADKWGGCCSAPI